MTKASDIPDFLRIDITHAADTMSFDPNALAIFLIETPEALAALDPVPDNVSILSGKPGLIYKTDQFEACLTPGEIARLTMRSLTPEEFKGFQRVFKGTVIHETHDDFYDQDTGAAMQPRL